MSEKRILFVEGNDDQHTVWALCKFFSVQETFIVEVPDSKGAINKKAKATEKGGIDNVLKAIRANLTSDAIECLGIVIDADQGLLLRWQKVLKLLAEAGYQNLPSQPDSNGTIIKEQFKPIFGVWIMPDNVTDRGMLEDFLAFLVPDKENNKSWAAATKCTQEIFVEENRFPEIHLSKAIIHAYLAWQKEPGKPFGQALTAKYLQPSNPLCDTFVTWLKRLFVDEEIATH